jgi:hypothetical protein
MARRPHRPTHAFTLVLTGADEITDALSDRLFEAGCDDALLGMRNGVLFLDFLRAAKSAEQAILSAISDVARSGTGVRAERVEPSDAVTAAEIARRLGRSRESVRLWILGERGPGGFPAPVSNVKRRSPVWRWSDVATWCAEALGDPGYESARDHARAVVAVNSALELSRVADDTQRILDAIKSARARSTRRKRAAKRKA